jgi:pimeloyl-ACP methyl ester carboxylesterase
MSVENNHTCQLLDGRDLAYAEYGDLSGKPVFYFHGNPGCRLDPMLMDQDVLIGRNIHLIAPDRPGVGLSTFQNKRRLSDWPADVTCLADRLGLDKFSVMGLSGGGPYGLACAHQIAPRLTRAVVVSGIGPLDNPELTRGMGPGRFYFYGARIHPLLAEGFLAMMTRGMKANKKTQTSSPPPGMPAVDQEIMQNPRIGKVFSDLMEEAVHSGYKGVAWDATLLARAWGFRLEEILMPVSLWHGEMDMNVPIAMGRRVANLIPECNARYYPNEGHFSLLIHHMEEIFQAF